MRGRAGLLFAAMAALNLLPVFWFSFLPVSDGPSHVYNASLVSRYFVERGEAVRSVVEFNRSIPPNMMAHGLMAVVMTVVSPTTAERLLIALYGLLLPLSLWYALRGVSERTHGLELIGLGLVFNSHLHWGFYNFLLGLVAYLFALGYWLRIRHRALTARAVIVMALAVTAMYFCHPVPLIEFWVSVSVISVVGTGSDPRDREGVRLLGERARGLLQAFVPSLPAAALYIHYVLTRPPGGVDTPAWPTLRYAGSLLVKLAPLATYTQVERVAAIALSIGVAAAVVWAWTSRAALTARHEVMAAALVSVLLVFLSPTEAAGGTLITPRLVYFPLFLALIWLASGRWSRRHASWVGALGIAIALATTAARWPIYQRYDSRMREFLTAAQEERDAGVVHFQTAANGTTLVLDGGGVPHLSAGAWGYVSAASNQLLMSDYEAETGYFPFVYRRGLNPSSYPLRVDCRIHARLVPGGEQRGRTGLAIDRFLMWVDRDYAETEPCIRSAMGTVRAERRTSQGTLLSFTPSHE